MMHRSRSYATQSHRRIVGAFVGTWVALLVTACGSGLAPILNVDNAPVVSGGHAPITRPYVRDAIVRALASRGWQIEQDKPDAIIATVVSAGHTATVQIQYDEHAFSIHHVSSSPELKFDGTSIHRRYNQWIDKLRIAIRAQLAVPTAPPGVAPPPSAAPGSPPPSAAPGSPPPGVPPTSPPPSAAGSDEAPAPPPPPPATAPGK
ncbi:MAG TPA: hypothetical protein VHZ95_16915 [Polyangiales bacterium]|nr:hypothetical protein [Polyangiales bacterium]